MPDVLSSTIIYSHQESVPGQACATLLIPIDLLLFLLVEEFDGTRYQSGSNFLINVGSGSSLCVVYFPR
jgi:hypothetical protein